MPIVFKSGVRVCHRRRRRDRHALIKRLALRLIQVLLGILIFSVCGEEGERQTKRFVRRARAQEIQRVPLIPLRYVDRRAVWLFQIMRPAVRLAVIEALRRKFAVMPLADVPHPVTIGAQQARIGFSPRRLKHLEGRIAVPRHPLPGEECGATDAADRGCDVGAAKTHALFGQLVQARRFDDRVPGHAQRIVPPVVSIEDEDVGPNCWAGAALRPGHKIAWREREQCY